MKNAHKGSCRRSPSGESCLKTELTDGEGLTPGHLESKMWSPNCGDCYIIAATEKSQTHSEEWGKSGKPADSVALVAAVFICCSWVAEKPGMSSYPMLLCPKLDARYSVSLTNIINKIRIRYQGKNLKNKKSRGAATVTSYPFRSSIQKAWDLVPAPPIHSLSPFCTFLQISKIN